MPPRQPRLAWQETWSSRGSNRPAEDSLLAEDSTSVEDILPAEDNSLAEDILPAEDSSPADAIAQAAGSSQVEESQDDVQWLDPSESGSSGWGGEGWGHRDPCLTPGLLPWVKRRLG